VRRGLAVALLCLTTTACGGVVADAPPEEEPAVVIPQLDDVAADLPALLDTPVGTLARDSAERRARRLTVRIRSTTCFGVGTGSGFALDANTLITNRHVVVGSDRLEVSTWDGRTFTASSASVGTVGDIAIVKVHGRLPQPARLGPRAGRGDPVTVVGYPLGGRLTLRRGTVVDRDDGRRFEIPGEVLRMTTLVKPGNSGGPVLDEQGRVVGVVFAIELATDWALAIPVESVQRLIRSGRLERAPTSCGALLAELRD
jgi:S1-C subfamily serine protease